LQGGILEKSRNATVLNFVPSEEKGGKLLEQEPKAGPRNAETFGRTAHGIPLRGSEE